jgi:hypothetical protein
MRRPQLLHSFLRSRGSRGRRRDHALIIRSSSAPQSCAWSAPDPTDIKRGPRQHLHPAGHESSEPGFMLSRTPELCSHQDNLYHAVAPGRAWHQRRPGRERKGPRRGSFRTHLCSMSGVWTNLAFGQHHMGLVPQSSIGRRSPVSPLRYASPVLSSDARCCQRTMLFLLDSTKLAVKKRGRFRGDM